MRHIWFVRWSPLAQCMSATWIGEDTSVHKADWIWLKNGWSVMDCVG